MKTIGKYLAILIAVVLLWNQVILKPFRVLSMLFHKMGHAVVAFLFGYGFKCFRGCIWVNGRLNGWRTRVVSFFYDIQRRIFGKYIVFCTDYVFKKDKCQKNIFLEVWQ